MIIDGLSNKIYVKEESSTDFDNLKVVARESTNTLYGTVGDSTALISWGINPFDD